MATQVRTARAGATPTALMMHTRPWRSSPLAGPGFSTLPSIISESSEEAETASHEQADLSAPESLHDFGQSRSQSSSSIVSHASASASGYSRNASASALLLFESEASRSSISLSPSTTHPTGTSSSHGHGNPRRPARLSRRPASAHSDVPHRNVAEASITLPPRARTISHNSRPASYAGTPSTMPATYSRDSPLSQLNTPKQVPSVSRDPSSNWMSSSPFGPAQTPKFSRLSMASPAVVMPLSAREYRKRRPKEPRGKTKENDTPSPSNVAFADNTMPAFKTPNDVPTVRISPPASEGAHQRRHPPSLTPGHIDPQSPPQPHVDQRSLKPFPQPAQLQARYTHPRSRSRPNTPPRSSPLAAQPISPKSSTGTFFSIASNPDGDPPPLPVPPHAPVSTSTPADNPNMANAAVSPRPRPRRKSYPDRLSNEPRLSLLEAMNRLSQESSSLHRLSGHSQTDDANRLSVVSQASGHTLFYDLDPEVGHTNVSRHGSRKSTRTHTQSLEDLSSTLARTGIEVVNGEGGLNGKANDMPRGKRNVRMVRISDMVEVSPAPVARPRKLTKSRRVSIRGSPAKETDVQSQTPERRASLLPWKSKGSVGRKGSVMYAGVAEKEMTGSATVSPPPIPTENAPSHTDAQPKLGSNNASTTTSTPPELSPRKSRRSAFSFLSTSTFPLSRRQKSNALPTVVGRGSDKDTHIKPKEGGTDGASTSIRTITQGSESTLTLGSQGVYDLTTLASSGGLSGRGAGSSSVPMLRRLNVQETELDRSQSLWEHQGGSTPSLVTNSSTITSSSAPRTPVRQLGGESFVPRPSGLKESFTDAPEEDSDGVQGRGKAPRSCMHRKVESSPLAHDAGVEMPEEEEGIHMPTHSSPGLLSPSPRRPSTPNSMLTTATETSASYASLSTVPTATSRSTSPSLSHSLVMGGKRDWTLAPHGEEVDGDEYPCALCGHVAPRSTSPVSPTSESMHPMFTVPLVTVPASAISYTRSKSVSAVHVRKGNGGASAGDKGERHSRLPVPVPVIANAGTKNDHVPIATTGHRAETPTAAVTTSPPKVKKRRRPQTAPAGMEDVALKFIEGTQVKGVDVVDLATTSKGHGQSRFKAVLKGLLKWSI